MHIQILAIICSLSVPTHLYQILAIRSHITIALMLYVPNGPIISSKTTTHLGLLFQQIAA